MTAHEAMTEINAAMGRLRAVRDTLGEHLAEGTCETGATKQMSELHDRVALAIAAYKRSG